MQATQVPEPTPPSLKQNLFAPAVQLVQAVPQAIREDYVDRMQSLIGFYRRELQLSGIDYCLLDTSQPLELGLMSYLMTRHRAL